MAPRKPYVRKDGKPSKIGRGRPSNPGGPKTIPTTAEQERLKVAKAKWAEERAKGGASPEATRKQRGRGRPSNNELLEFLKEQEDGDDETGKDDLTVTSSKQCFALPRIINHKMDDPGMKSPASLRRDLDGFFSSLPAPKIYPTENDVFAKVWESYYTVSEQEHRHHVCKQPCEVRKCTDEGDEMARQLCMKSKGKCSDECNRQGPNSSNSLNYSARMCEEPPGRKSPKKKIPFWSGEKILKPCSTKHNENDDDDFRPQTSLKCLQRFILDDTSSEGDDEDVMKTLATLKSEKIHDQSVSGKNREEKIPLLFRKKASKICAPNDTESSDEDLKPLAILKADKVHGNLEGETNCPEEVPSRCQEKLSQTISPKEEEDDTEDLLPLATFKPKKTCDQLAKKRNPNRKIPSQCRMNILGSSSQKDMGYNHEDMNYLATVKYEDVYDVMGSIFSPSNVNSDANTEDCNAKQNPEPDGLVVETPPVPQQEQQLTWNREVDQTELPVAECVVQLHRMKRPIDNNVQLERDQRKRKKQFVHDKECVVQLHRVKLHRDSNKQLTANQVEYQKKQTPFYKDCVAQLHRMKLHRDGNKQLTDNNAEQQNTQPAFGKGCVVQLNINVNVNEELLMTQQLKAEESVCLHEQREEDLGSPDKNGGIEFSIEETEQQYARDETESGQCMEEQTEQGCPGEQMEQKNLTEVPTEKEQGTEKQFEEGQCTEGQTEQGESSEKPFEGDRCTEKQTEQEESTENPFDEGQCTERQTEQEKSTEKQFKEDQCTERQTEQDESTEKQFEGGQCTEKQTEQDECTEKQFEEGQCTERQTEQDESTEKQFEEGRCTEEQTEHEKCTGKQFEESQCTEKQTEQDESTEKQFEGGRCTEKQTEQEKCTERQFEEGQCTEGQTEQDEYTEKQFEEGQCAERQTELDESTEKQFEGGRCTEKQTEQEKCTEKQFEEGQCTERQVEKDQFSNELIEQEVQSTDNQTEEQCTENEIELHQSTEDHTEKEQVTEKGTEERSTDNRTAQEPFTEKGTAGKRGKEGKKSSKKNSKTKRNSNVLFSRKRVLFTKVEEDNLTNGILQFGIGNWRKILENYDFHVSRTSVSIKDKYRTMVRQGLLAARIDGDGNVVLANSNLCNNVFEKRKETTVETCAMKIT